MPEKLKVLFVPIGYQASGMYRMTLPAYYMNNNGNIEVCAEPAGATITSTLVDMFDVVVLQRCASKSMLDLIQYCKNAGKKLVMDVDDLFVEVPDWNPAKSSYRSENLTIHSQIIKMVDLITVTTPKLAEYYKGSAKTVKILPNCVDFKLYDDNVNNARIENKDNQIRLLWMGSATHQEDFRIIEDVVTKLIEKYNIKFVVYGQLPENMIMDKFSPQNIEYHGFTPFNFYYQSLHRINATIGIAPLVDIRFNEFKSQLKVLEYGMMGLPVVASDIYPYKLVIENGTNGLLVKNKYVDWYEAIESLILDSEKRNTFAANLNAKIKDKYNLKTNAKDWENTYLALANSGTNNGTK